jgi:hypothetical protein
VSDTNGTAVDDVAPPAPDTHTPDPRATPSRKGTHPRGSGDAPTTFDTITTSALTPVLLDRAVVRAASEELSRRYGPLEPALRIGVAVLLAEGLERCQAAWAERHEHATTAARYDRGDEKTARYEIPTKLADAVRKLADDEYPGAGPMVGRVASAALWEGVTMSKLRDPLSDPGLETVARLIGHPG